MKLIIDIPDNIYYAIKITQPFISGQRSGKTYLQILVNSVQNGIPLDDVIEEYVERGATTENIIMLDKIDSIKAEIKEQKSKRALQDDDLHWYREGINDVLVIIDKHIEDMQGKSCSTCKCYTCKNNDDELSGECYECIKGIFDHYEPYESEDKK